MELGPKEHLAIENSIVQPKEEITGDEWGEKRDKIMEWAENVVMQSRVVTHIMLGDLLVDWDKEPVFVITPLGKKKETFQNMPSDRFRIIQTKGMDI